LGDSRRRRWMPVQFGVLVAFALLGAGTVVAGTMAADDSYAAVEDQELAVPAPGVLGNDTPEGELCVTGFDASNLKGSLGEGVAEDGSFTFTPDPDDHGLTGFDYEVALIVDGVCPDAIESTAFVTIGIDGVNDAAPIAVRDSFQAIADRVLTIAAPGVLKNDSDFDGGPLTAIKVDDPAHGDVFLEKDGGFTYLPTTGYRGPDAFSYKASDGTLTSQTRIVTLTVTALPTPVPTVAPTPGPTVEVTVTGAPSPPSSAEAPVSSDPFASASAGPAGASASPGASIAPVSVEEEGGLSIPALVVGLLLLSLLAFGGAFLLPRWLKRQRAGGSIDEGPPGTA
jgi:Bacterial Ig domain